MTTVQIEEIKNNAETYLQKVEQGETVLIERAGVPVAEMIPVKPKEKKLRPIGLCKGEIYISDDFDDPLPDEILDLFEGK